MNIKSVTSIVSVCIFICLMEIFYFIIFNSLQRVLIELLEAMRADIKSLALGIILSFQSEQHSRKVLF